MKIANKYKLTIQFLVGLTLAVALGVSTMLIVIQNN